MKDNIFTAVCFSEPKKEALHQGFEFVALSQSFNSIDFKLHGVILVSPNQEFVMYILKKISIEGQEIQILGVGTMPANL